MTAPCIEGLALVFREAAPHPVRLAHGEGVAAAGFDHRTAEAHLFGCARPDAALAIAREIVALAQRTRAQGAPATEIGAAAS